MNYKFLFYFFLSVFVIEINGGDENLNLLPDKDSCGQHKSLGSDSIGTNANLGEFPWLALLKYTTGKETNSGYRCIGSLINPRYILTTALCANPKEVTLAEVRLGEHDLNSEKDCQNDGDKECSDVQNVGVEDRIIYSGYNPKINDNDIALIRLNKTVTYTDYIKPICLPKKDAKDVEEGATVTASGWGRTPNGNLVTIKKRVISAVMDKEKCANDYKKVNASITINHLCTKALTNNIRFTCAGDSGGPVMYQDNNQWYQIGITSFGVSCGYILPDVNTKVVNYIDWILENIKE